MNGRVFGHSALGSPQFEMAGRGAITLVAWEERGLGLADPPWCVEDELSRLGRAGV
jgi:hypothetical protein